MLTPTRTAEQYTLQAMGDMGWVALSHYGEGCLDDAVRHCQRAVWTTKGHCRVIENHDGFNVVCERFYNRDDDREARFYDDDWMYEDEDDLELSWKEDGF